MILHGDCLALLGELPDNSIDSIVTDPPYGLSFMGKKWDYDVPSVEIWREALRVLKPGGHLLSFGGTRTYHRMVVNIEDAGFEIRDQVMWLYGSGFPKSMDVSKAIDKQAGIEREVTGQMRGHVDSGGVHDDDNYDRKDKPATDAAKQWEGWGTALKPANEPICLARKPLEKGFTVAQNVLKWGTGALNIDASRIATDDKLSGSGSACLKFGGQNSRPYQETFKPKGCQQHAQGRWPANVLFDEEAAEVLDEQSGISVSRPHKNKTSGQSGTFNASEGEAFSPRNDKGGASRFFYCAKSSKRERGQDNNHPTVKPIKLMEYLIKMITPPGGIVLDPFMGSGTTGVAAKNLGFDFIGIERDAEYVEIANKRIG